MEQIDTILEKERTNMDGIFLYLLHDGFIAFGFSAYYAALLCPKFTVNRSHSDATGAFVCVLIPDNLLRLLSEKYNTLVDDECIRIAAPLNICRQRDYFPDWERQQLLLASKIEIK